MTINSNSRFLTVSLFILLCYIQVFLLTPAAFADQKIDVDALPMKPVISAPSPELNWFKARFGLTWNELAKNYSIEEVDRFLQRWRSTYPDDPEAWISSATWNEQQSQQKQFHLSTSESGTYITEEGSFVYIYGKESDGDRENLAFHSPDEQQGEFMSSSTYIDKNRVSEALRFYQEAQKRFPYRVDVYDGLVALYFRLGQYNNQVDTLRAMSRAIMHTDRELEGANYYKEKLNASKKQGILSVSCQKSLMLLSQQNSKAALNAQLELTLLMTHTLPGNPIAWNNLVQIYYRNGDKLAAYKAASKAYEIDPKDEIIVINLATLCIELGLKEEAVKHYHWILSNSKDPKMKAQARADLKLLGISN